MRSSRRPQGSSWAPASGEGAQVLPGGLAVQFKLRAGQTAGRLSITEMTLDPHRLAPPHVHADEDEYTDVAAGTIGVRVADEECEAARGCYLVKPRGVAHAFWNPTDKLARTVEVIAPAGLRPSSKNWRRRPRPAMPGRPSNDGRTSRPSTGSATSPNWCPP